MLTTQAAFAILPVVPSLPPSTNQPYNGANTTANVRAALQKAIDTYAPGSSTLVLSQATPSDLKRSDTRSFGQTHANQLDNLGSHPMRPITPPANPQDSTPSVQSTKLGSSPISGIASSPPAGQQSPPLNPAALNQAPAPIPISPESSNTISPVAAPNPEDPTVKIPSALPTVAETGLPKSAGPDGPGPASGSLLNLKSDIHAQKQPEEQLPVYDGPVSGSAVPPEKPKWESAEEEKRRLEREERERILSGQGSSSRNTAPPPPPPGGEGPDDELPAYKEF